MEFKEKTGQLRSRLKKLENVVIAFSGGKDSYFLLKKALDVLGKDHVTAVFVHTILHSKIESKRINYFLDRLDVNLVTLNINVADEKEVMSNPKDRCYYCKRKIFEIIIKEIKCNSNKRLLDGTTYSDLKEYRPGLQALQEYQVLSLLKQCKISSGEIADFLRRETDIDPFMITSSTCLATRFPYDHKLSNGELRRFDAVETFLIDNGIFPVRVRYITDGIRIETDRELFGKIIEFSQEIVACSRKFGFKFVNLDLGGIKSGVWD